jgi:hypothetical protein
LFIFGLIPVELWKKMGDPTGGASPGSNHKFDEFSTETININLNSFSNDLTHRELVIDEVRVIMTEKSLKRLAKILWQEYPQNQRMSLQVANPSIPPKYKLSRTSVPDTRSGWSEGRRYEYFEDDEANQAFRILGPTNKHSPFHRLGKIDDPQSRIGRFWAHFPNDTARKKDLVDMYAYGYQTLKAMLDILVNHGKVKEVLVATTKNGNRIVAYARVRNTSFSSRKS